MEEEPDFPHAMSKGVESESIQGFGSQQENCSSSSVIVVGDVKTAEKANDA